MRAMTIILAMSAILIGAAVTRGITYSLTHAFGLAPAETTHQSAER